MKNPAILLSLALALLVTIPVFGQAPALPAELGPHQWTATVKVIGEDSNSIAGADVALSYSVPGPGPNQPRFGEVKGVTDKDGMFNASHTDSSLGLAAVVNKSGYYASHIGHQFYYDEKNRHPVFTMMLKTVRKPIPMYAKQINLGIPVFDKSLGFDLMAGDWVAPYGKGENADLVITAHLDKRTESEAASKLVVSFPKTGDGIQKFYPSPSEVGSGLRSGHEAPTEGYQPEWIQTRNRRPRQQEGGNFEPNGNYFIRVRTVLNADGTIKSALYGKIYGDFMQLTYYLNPTPNSRNVEFDPSHNLIGNLPFDEQAHQP